jgi:hypothetical protein
MIAPSLFRWGNLALPDPVGELALLCAAGRVGMDVRVVAGTHKSGLLMERSLREVGRQ